MSTWDDPDLQTGGEYYDFEAVGTVASGTVKVVRTHTFDDGKKVPQLILVDDTTGEDRTLTAGQVRLKAALVEQRPEPGDHLRVTYTQKENRAGGKTLKHFDVAVTRGNGAALPIQTASSSTQPLPDLPPTAYPADAQPLPNPTPAAPAAVDPAAAAAALAALSPEQRAALGL